MKCTICNDFSPFEPVKEYENLYECQNCGSLYKLTLVDQGKKQP